MPETLDMNWLLSQPKYRNIHHDSFCRADSKSEIGHNALPSRPNVLGYSTMTLGTIRVGIHNNYVTNFVKRIRTGRTIKYVNADRFDYHITAVKAKERNCDVKVAFYIRDINNFYFACLEETQYEVFKYLKGKRKLVAKGDIGGNRLEVNVKGKSAEIVVDGIIIQEINLNEWTCSQNICGLVFENQSVSKVDDFIVDYRDQFEDIGIDSAVERGEVEKPVFGTYCAEKGVCSASSKLTNGTEKSYRFELKKPTQAQVNASRDNALHSTVMLNRIKKGGNKPLDSFILTLDVLFPDTGDEAWLLDELFAELIIQVHHAGYNIPFSPSLSINIDKGRLYLSTIWLETMPKGKSPFGNDLGYKKEFFSRINSNEEESLLKRKGYGDFRHLPYIEKGKWHNITLYAKLGYNENQQPRTVLYLDQKKRADWTTPNAYNCQEFGEFMEFGIYKWNWNTQENRDKTPLTKRVIYFDNINFFI